MSSDMYLTEREARAKRLEANAKERLRQLSGNDEPQGLSDTARAALVFDEPTPAMREWCDDLDTRERDSLKRQADLTGWEPRDHSDLEEPVTEYLAANRLNYEQATIAVGSDRYVPESEGGGGGTLPMDRTIRRMVTKHDYVEEIVLQSGNSANRVRYVKQPGENIMVDNDATGKAEPVARTRGYQELRRNGQSARNTKRGQYWSDPTADAAQRGNRTGAETIMTVIMNRAQLTAFLTLVKITVGKSSFRDHGRIRDLATLIEVTPNGDNAAVAMFTARDFRKIRKETRKTHASHNDYRDIFQIMPK